MLGILFRANSKGNKVKKSEYIFTVQCPETSCKYRRSCSVPGESVRRIGDVYPMAINVSRYCQTLSRRISFEAKR